jgi:hypothetical protein
MTSRGNLLRHSFARTTLYYMAQRINVSNPRAVLAQKCSLLFSDDRLAVGTGTVCVE